jgi:hypothetical protein
MIFPSIYHDALSGRAHIMIDLGAKHNTCIARGRGNDRWEMWTEGIIGGFQPVCYRSMGSLDWGVGSNGTESRSKRDKYPPT